ncbi:hypothetical protein SAMN05216388_103813 [Halorientalis persicus]|uniref:Geranylgeranyl transferase type II subunit beta n=1 Tax=Halorientalis persicus TaxID=1367881 RepID=A0A1H8VII0_9EURY|nr:hypothetical protein [Halorientalis persicus]SEP15189.1 hypothetical protein SAMN05216388_103813 [Halorientalis persicus]
MNGRTFGLLILVVVSVFAGSLIIGDQITGNKNKNIGEITPSNKQEPNSTTKVQEPETGHNAAPDTAITDSGSLSTLASPETVDAIRMAQTPYGYTNLNSLEKDLYATYQYSELLTDTENVGSMQYRNRTANWLRNYTTSELNDGYLSTTYYYAASLENFGVRPAINTSDIIHIVEQHNHSNGTYCSVRNLTTGCEDVNGVVTPTYQAIAIKSVLGTNVSHSTKTWVKTKWKQYNISSSGDIIRAQKLHRALSILNYSDGEIRSISNKSNQIEGISDEIVGDSKVSLRARASYLTLSELMNIQDKTVRWEVCSDIAQSQNRDGGFSITGQNISDAYGTRIALEILTNECEHSINSTQAQTFIEQHEIPQGGFALHYRRKTSIRRTFYASQILSDNAPAHLDQTAIKQLLKQASTLVRDPQTPVVTVSRLATLDRLTNSSQIPPAQFRSYTHSRLESLPRSNRYSRTDFVNISHLLKLAELNNIDYNREHLIEQIKSHQNSDGGFGPQNTSDLVSTYHSVKILNQLGTVPNREDAVRRWIREARVTNSGFRGRIGDRFQRVASLPGTYYSIRTLSLLQSDPVNARSLKRWLAQFKHPNGGYMIDSSPDSASSRDIEQTYYATRIRSLLHDNQTHG